MFRTTVWREVTDAGLADEAPAYFNNGDVDVRGRPGGVNSTSVILNRWLPTIGSVIASVQRGSPTRASLLKFMPRFP